MEKDIKININLTKYLDYLMIGEKCISYRNPLFIERLSEYGDKITIYTKQINNYQLAFEKDSFLNAIEKFKQERENESR